MLALNAERKEALGFAMGCLELETGPDSKQDACTLLVLLSARNETTARLSHPTALEKNNKAGTTNVADSRYASVPQ